MSLTDGDINAAMEWASARLRADRSRPRRLKLTPNRPEEALGTPRADGWVEIGEIVDPDWQHDWRVWLNVESGDRVENPWTQEPQDSTLLTGRRA
jgi:hypothetical protein